MQVQPYLFFEGRCAEALAFYQETIGAEVQMRMRYADAPDQTGIPPENAEKIMHASVRIGETVVFASDGHCAGTPSFGGFGLSLTVAGKEDAERLFTALGAGGAVRMPLAETFFSPRFGMLTDRFGVLWMIMAR